MEYSAKALILAQMFDELDARGQAVLYAVAKSERSFMRDEAMYKDYCSNPDQSCCSSQKTQDQLR